MSPRVFLPLPSSSNSGVALKLGGSMSEDKFGQSMSRLVKSQRLFPVLIFALLFIPSAHGQKKWSGHMLEEQNQPPIPNKPPEAVCNDGSLAYRVGPADNFRQHYCDGHGGVKQFVNNQYVGFDDEKSLIQEPEQQTSKPPKQDVPQSKKKGAVPQPVKAKF